MLRLLEAKRFSYRKVIGHGYDGVSPFSGKNTGVQQRIHTLDGHRLQLASIQAAECASDSKDVWHDDQPLESVLLLPI